MNGQENGRQDGQESSQRHWLRWLLPLGTVVVLVHLLTVWLAPRLIMQIVLHGPAAQKMNMRNQAAFPPPISAASRDVVLPSPDMLYAMCAFDASSGPIRIAANPSLKSYWSIALYSASSDNFFVINDRRAGNSPVNLWLVPEGGDTSRPSVPVPVGAQTVKTPGTEGLVLMRVLTENYAQQKEIVEAARRTLRCAPG